MIQSLAGIWILGVFFCFFIAVDTSPKLSVMVAATFFWPIALFILGFKGLKEIWEE